MSLVEFFSGKPKITNKPEQLPSTTEYRSGKFRPVLMVKEQGGRTIAATPYGELTPKGRVIIKQQATKSPFL